MRALLVLLCLLFPTAAFAQSLTVTPVATSAPANGLVLNAAPSSAYGFELYSKTNDGIAYLLNTTTIPADGAVTPARCYPVVAGTAITVAYQPVNLTMAAGATIVFGTTAGSCYNLIKQNADFIAGEAR